MVRKPDLRILFERKDRTKNLPDESTVKFAQGKNIDPALLFQRILVLSKNPRLEEAMSYQLSPFSTALFQAKEIFRKLEKLKLAHAVI